MRISLLVLLSLSSLCALAQSGRIKGSVKTSDQQVAPYVSIVLKGTNKVTTTDLNGAYEIKNVQPGSHTLSISFVGHEAKEIKVEVKSNETTTIAEIVLNENSKQLNEVEVRGTREGYKSTSSDYANKMTLSNLENAQTYTTITKGLIKDQILFSVDDAMRNVVGMQKMWDATSRSGDGGSYFSLRGFVLQSTMRNGLASVVSTTSDASNIEKMEVLKGPSATLYGSALTSYGGLVNRVTKKPYDQFGGEVNVSGGSYQFLRASADINTPIDNAKKVMFRFNGAYNTQGSFQKEAGTGNRFFAAPSLLIKPNDRLSISLESEITYAKALPAQFVFMYFSPTDLGFNRADQSGLDYKQSYTGKGIQATSHSTNYFANLSYKISEGFTSSTNVSYSKSYSQGPSQYFYQIPNYYVTGNASDIGTVSHYLARADQSTDNSSRTIFEVQQFFNGEFNIGGLRNRVVFGLDYTNINSDQHFKSPYSYIDVVPTNVAGYDYTRFDGGAIKNFYDTATFGVSYGAYPDVNKTNIYSAFASDVLNITDNFLVIAALRLDHFNNNTILSWATSTPIEYNQTALSPKFGVVYQVVKDQVSLFANYQNSFTNQGQYTAYDVNTSSLVSRYAKPQRANQWEVGAKTNLVENKLSASLSYYDITVDNILRTDPNNPANAQIQNGTQSSKGVELEVMTNPFKGFTVFGGFAYNDSKYKKISDDVNGLRPTTAGSPFVANWWLSYRIMNGAVKGLHVGFGGNYANDNKVYNTRNTDDGTVTTFILPAYTLFNATVGYEYKNYSIAVKADNLTNTKYWTGYTTYNAQMLRQFVGSIAYKF